VRSKGDSLSLSLSRKCAPGNAGSFLEGVQSVWFFDEQKVEYSLASMSVNNFSLTLTVETTAALSETEITTRSFTSLTRSSQRTRN